MHLRMPGFVPQGVPTSGRVMPLTIRQMVVQQVQLEAIRRREAVSTLEDTQPLLKLQLMLLLPGHQHRIQMVEPFLSVMEDAENVLHAVIPSGAG